MDALTIRRGVNYDAYFDSYTDDTKDTRIDYEGWRFVLSLATPRREDRTWATDDENPTLTVVAATAPPDGNRLAWRLSAAQTAALDRGGKLTLLRVDPADPTNVEELTEPVPVNVTKKP